MLLEFSFSNYRSFRDENCLSMEANGLKTFKSSLLSFGRKDYLPVIAVYGRNGGGKSNLIRAFWLAVQFIRNAQRTQHESAPIPVHPFRLNDYSESKASSFEFDYVTDGVRYLYGFSATNAAIEEEYLYHWPKGQKAMVFHRSAQIFDFPTNSEKKRKEMIGGAVASNQLYFAVACTMNEPSCIAAMKWFREKVFFSRDYTDIPPQLIDNLDNPEILQAIKSYAEFADVGIKDMHFELHNQEIDGSSILPENMPENIRNAMTQLIQALADAPNSSETKLKMGAVKVTSYHQGICASGEKELYPLGLADESDGTRRLMALAPAFEKILSEGGIFVVDELDEDLHPILTKALVSKLQSSATNQKQAQMIFTTHNPEFLNLDLLRRDQFYFVDKNRNDGVSSLYSIATQTNENMMKSYMAGKYGATPYVEIEEVE